MPKYMHTKTERLWHWVHVVLMVLLALSGFQVHFPAFKVFPSMKAAVAVHNAAGVALAFDYLLWLGYNLITARMLQYIPRPWELWRGALVQAKFYLWDIFRGKPHPFETGPENKYNPLQRITYFVTMLLALPLQILTGLTLLFVDVPWVRGLVGRLGGVPTVELVHLALGYYFVLFILAHIYLGTTGHTPLSLYKAMFTGWEE